MGDLGNIANGGNASLTIQTNASALGTHVNTARAFSDVTDTATANNYATIAITVTDSGVGPPPPALEVTQAGATIYIAWPSGTVGYMLQTTTNLAPIIQWSVISNGISDDGTWKTYSITNSADGNRFFRLIQ